MPAKPEIPMTASAAPLVTFPGWHTWYRLCLTLAQIMGAIASLADSTGRHTMQRQTLVGIPTALLAGLLSAGIARADVAATGTFGINVDVSFPFTSGTFDGAITGFDGGPFMVGATPVDLATDVVSMTIPTSNLLNIDIGALAVTFDVSAVDDDLTLNDFGFAGGGVAVCEDAITCAQGQGTFVGDITSLTDPSDLLPDGWVYTFDGTVMVSAGAFDAEGAFGINAFLPKNLPAGLAAQVTSDPTSFFDSRRNTLRDFLVDLTFAEVTTPGTVSFVGKSAVPGAFPASIGFDPDVSVYVDITTGGGAAFTPPVEVCFHYEDSSPTDGIVDGTSVAVDTLKVLHAATIGDPFLDVTSAAPGSGVVCGEVDQLSPVALGVGAPFGTTTTTVTSVTSTTLQTTTTIVGTTTTTTLPVPPCDEAITCIPVLQQVVETALCPGIEVPKRMTKITAKKLRKAEKLIGKIGRAKTVKKGERLLAKSAKQIDAVNAKAEKFTLKRKNPLDPTCRDRIAELLAPLAQAIAERRLGVPFPTGGGGNCSGNQDMKATIGSVSFSKGPDGSVRHENFGGFISVQGCYIPSGGGPACREVLYLSFGFFGGGPTTIECGPFSNVLIEYDDFSGTFFSSTACSLTVEGDPDGQLSGTWTATMTDFGFPTPTEVQASGCFRSRPFPTFPLDG